jgi:hypothetical protein
MIFTTDVKFKNLHGFELFPDFKIVDGDWAEFSG